MVKETPIQGGIRELFEETGIKAYNNIDGEFIMDGNNPLILENVGKHMYYYLIILEKIIQ